MCRCGLTLLDGPRDKCPYCGIITGRKSSEPEPERRQSKEDVLAEFDAHVAATGKAAREQAARQLAESGVAPAKKNKQGADARKPIKRRGPQQRTKERWKREDEAAGV